jgi:four helix bundle protein
MAKSNLIVEATYAFALQAMETSRQIRERKEFELASQLWRSGTSIGANVEEAQAAQSRADFLSKMAIAAKEARETRYWLRLIRDGKILPRETIHPLLEEIESILRILTSIVKTTSESKIQNPKSKIAPTP